MQLNPIKLERSIKLARDISDNYSNYALDPRTNVKSTDYLRDICKQYLNKNIEYSLHKMPFTDGLTKGFYISKKDDSYEVVLLSGLNFCWKRLVLCKELFHVVLDEEESRHETVNQLVDDIAMHINLENGNEAPSLPLQTEFLAEISAMEFLFPYTERTLKISSGKLDYSAIAEQYKLPRFYVEMYLSNSFMDVLKDF